MGIRKLICAAGMAATAFAASPAAAQVTATDEADGRALILVPLTLVKIDDLDFGTVVTSSASGTVTINASSGGRSVAGGVTGVTSDPGNRAYFAGAGAVNQQVIVAISPPLALANANGDTIPVLGMTLDGPPIRTIDATRAFYVGVGGTIQVGADQAEGDYNADFWLTAIYQ